MDITYRSTGLEERVIFPFIDGSHVGLDEGLVTTKVYSKGDNTYQAKRVNHGGYQVDCRRKVRDRADVELFNPENICWERFKIRRSVRVERDDGARIFIGYVEVGLEKRYDKFGDSKGVLVTTDEGKKFFPDYQGYDGVWNYVNQALAADEQLVEKVASEHGWEIERVIGDKTREDFEGVSPENPDFQ